jgi:signal transduction histidine kinase
MRSFLGVPIKVRDEVYGSIYLTDKQGATEFTAEDQALVEALAVAAGVAIENTWLHQQVQTLAVAADRERTARDLHDTVIQHLYAVGLSLETMASEPAAVDLRIRLEQLVANVGEAIRQVRSSIYDLGPTGTGVRVRIEALVHSLRPVVGFEIALVVDGPVDSVVSDAVATQLLATVREAVTNIGRHASATAAEVAVTLDGGVCELRVLDDGRGIDPDRANPDGLGLDNMRRRAETLDGACTIGPSPAGGTVVTWRVPVTS